MLPSAFALPFISLPRNASDVIKRAGVKMKPFLLPRLQAAFPVETSTFPSLINFKKHL